MYHLDIPKTRQYDNGKVEVIARSSVGETRCETTLTVKPRSDDYRGVLKNSPRRKYTSPWGSGTWNTRNLVHPPEFFEFTKNFENPMNSTRVNEFEWLKTRKYMSSLLPNTDDAAGKTRDSRNDSTLYRSYLTLAQVEHKSMNTPNFTEISLKNSSIQHKFSTRHIQSVSESRGQSVNNYSTTVLLPDNRDSNTTKISKIAFHRPCTCSHCIPVVSTIAASTDETTIDIRENKNQLRTEQYHESVCFTHTARKDLLHVWDTAKIIR